MQFLVTKKHGAGGASLLLSDFTMPYFQPSGSLSSWPVDMVAIVGRPMFSLCHSCHMRSVIKETREILSSLGRSYYSTAAGGCEVCA